jgi:uncharacterized protein YjbI with pentapeptide repeats
MKTRLFAIIVTISAISLALPTQAENLTHLNQLLSTKECPQCDLSTSGLVMIDLAGAKLKDANLNNANLSQANLSGADLSGANLAGASLYGANLNGANLSGANLNGTDLRNTYLVNANLHDVDLSNVFLEGAKGLPEYAGTPEQFYHWGVKEAQRGNYQAATINYQKAIALNSKFAPAYLGLGLIQYHLDRPAEAQANAKIASDLFTKQKNKVGSQSAQQFLQRMELARQWEAKKAEANQGGSNFGKFVGGVGSLMLQFLLK